MTFLEKLPVNVRVSQKIWYSFLFLGLGAVLGRGLSFLRIVLYARLVAPEQLGLFSLAFGAASFLMPFVISGSASLLVRYVSYAGVTKQLIWVALKKPLIALGCISLFLMVGHRLVSIFVFGQPGFFVLSLLIGVDLFGLVFVSLVSATFQGAQRFDVSVISEIIYSVMSVISGIGLILIIKPTAEYLMMGSLIGSSAVALFLALVGPKVLGQFKSSNTTNPEMISDLPVREIEEFGNWMTLAAIAYIFVNWGMFTRWILGRQVSMEDTGRLYVVLMLSWIPYLLFQLITTAVQPRLAGMFHNGDINRVRILTNKLLNWGIPACLILCALIYIFLRLFLINVLGEQYNVSRAVIGFLCLSCFYHVALLLNSMLATAEGRSKTVFFSNLFCAVVNVVFSFLFTYQWGVEGAALALALSFFAASLLISLLNRYVKFNFCINYWIWLIAPISLICYF